MAGKERHYFARGNTAKGLVNLVESNFKGLDRVYILEGDPQMNGTVLNRLADAWSGEEWSLELIHHPLQSELLEGILIKEARIGLIDSGAWPVGWLPDGTEIRSINFNEGLNTEKYALQQEQIAALQKSIAQGYAKAYETFARTLRIHDDWEQIYIDALDRERMNRLAVEWTEQYLLGSAELRDSPIKSGAANNNGASASNGNHEGELAAEEGPQLVTHRFLGAATAAGAVDFIMNLTEDIRTRVFIKGRPGSGKSTLFKKIAEFAKQNSIETEIYHCGFDPNSLDMLIFPQANVAVFDSTAPHEHFPSREGDRILDVYELAIAEGTDERFAREIAEVKSQYTTSMQIAISYLAEVKHSQDTLSLLYREALDPMKVAELEHLLKEEVESVGQQR